jgi:hypothetical protein
MQAGNEIDPLFRKLRAAANGRFTGCPLDWMERNIVLPHSARATRFDREVAPQLNDIIRTFASGEFRQIAIRAPVGGGKTTLLELLVPYVVAEDPGGMLLVGQSDDMAKDFAETRLLPILKGCEKTARLFPSDRHQKRKTSILFPHMPLFIAGANLSSLQEKSMRYVWMDELWRWKAGMIGEAQRRTHDRWNSVIIGVSQGWDDTHDAEAFFNAGEQHQWGVACPGCGEWHRMIWSNVKWDNVYRGTQPDWEAIGNSVRYQCPKCKHESPDTSNARRELANRGRWQKAPSNSIAGCRSFHYSALAVYWIPWRDLVVEWIKADILRKAGDLSALRQFLQKRLAEVWKEEINQAPVDLRGANYNKADYTEGQKIEDEVWRFLTIDRQQDHWWALCRAWRADGTSRLIWEGMVLTLETIRHLQETLGVRDVCVFQDSGYSAGTVYDECGANNWNAMKGSGMGGFWVGGAKRRYQRPFSEPGVVRGPKGHVCKLIVWSNEVIKDELVKLRAKGAPTWEHPKDVSQDWLAHMTSEIKRDTIDSKTKQVKQRYVQVKGENHLWDCEAMQVVAAAHFGVLGKIEAKD